MVRRVVIMSGAPGSGKSHTVRKIMEENDIWLSRDNVRANVRQILNSNDYFPVCSRCEDKIWHAIVEDVIWNSDADTVYIDQTTVNWKSFRKLWKGVYLDEADIPVTFMRIDTPLKVCIERNDKRHPLEKVPNSSLISMWESFNNSKKEEMPKEFEGKVNIVYIVNDNS